MWQQCSEPKDCGQWVTPPASPESPQRSYARGDDDVIYRRVWDQQTGARFYAKRFLEEGEVFEPWQTEPK